MPPKGRLIAAALIAFVAGAVLVFPARVAYRWFAPPEIALSGIEGSVWRGAASNAAIYGMYARDLEWRFRPLKILAGRLSYRISATPIGGFVDGEVSVAVGGTLRITDLRASVPLGVVAEIVRLPGLGGLANAQFERLELLDGVPTAADGVLEVASLRVPLVAPAAIGGYEAEFFTESDAVVASVEDTDGLIDVAGRLILKPDRSYQFLGQIAPKAETPDSLRSQMQFLGSANARGQYELRLEGSL